jgi:hypothetical protein
MKKTSLFDTFVNLDMGTLSENNPEEKVSHLFLSFLKGDFALYELEIILPIDTQKFTTLNLLQVKYGLKTKFRSFVALKKN